MTSTSSPSWWTRTLGHVGGAILGAVLLVAAWGKALDPMAFAEEIRAQGLELFLTAPVLAVLFVAVEVALGVALVLGLRRSWVMVPTTAMVGLFLFLNGRAYWRFSQGLIDASESCGCFGSLVSRTPAEAFWQDLFLLVPPLLVAFLPQGEPGARLLARRVTVGVATVAAVVFAALAPRLPLDDLATRLAPGARVSELCAGREEGGSVRICLDSLVPELEEGSHLVIIAPVEDADLAARVAELNQLSGDPKAPRVWLLTASEEEERAAFFWQYGPTFEIREVPETLLRLLYRTTPRSFAARDGGVEQTFAGIPRLSEVASGAPAAIESRKPGAG
jgi:uncharacterized membrane protein YphA (DoxX/SURF4 family)